MTREDTGLHTLFDLELNIKYVLALKEILKHLLKRLARQIKMATMKLELIPKEIASAILSLQLGSAFFERLGIPRLYNWNKGNVLNSDKI